MVSPRANTSTRFQEDDLSRQMQTAHADLVEKVKTGQGMTKFLVSNEKGGGANVHDPLLGAGDGYPDPQPPVR